MTDTQVITDMRNAFDDELKYMEKGQSEMRGSQIYINLMEYVKKICYDNNLNDIDENENEEEIIDGIRGQFELDFINYESASSFMMELEVYLNKVLIILILNGLKMLMSIINGIVVSAVMLRHSLKTRLIL